ncbi:MAG: hypothetical protein K2H79_09375, partial [Bacteroidaceae bacterium]|nr:hypothetical protein [Bacteroidaceae bacterium]
RSQENGRTGSSIGSHAEVGRRAKENEKIKNRKHEKEVLLYFTTYILHTSYECLQNREYR